MRDPSRFHLKTAEAALLVIDVQEKLAAVMDPASFREVERNIARWIEAAKVLGLPIVWTEQYVKGLGPTVAALRAVMPEGLAPVEKMAFSCLAEPAVKAALKGRTQVIAIGMETHVCVFQTLRDLEAQGVRTFVAADAVISRAESNRQAGLDLARQLGSTVISTELGLFDLVERSGTDSFRAISRLVK